MERSRKPLALYGDDARSWKLLFAILAVFLIGFATYYPQIITVSDEVGYIDLAQKFTTSEPASFRLDPLTRLPVQILKGQYPPGTALVMAPFVWIAGWKGAFTGIALCLVASVILTALWLRSRGASPLYALVIMSFPASVPMGRLGMSDVPGMAVVALGFWCFWNGTRGGSERVRLLWWLAAGFVAGASSLIRVTNILPFVAFFVGAVIRRDDRRRSLALILGGVAGIGLRLAAGWLIYGSAFAVNAEYPFDPASMGERLPLYLFGLTVFVPGGLILGLLYRGPRRPEMIITLVSYFLFFLLQNYSTVHSTLPKRIVLALRYFLPLLPVLAFAMAESTPRLWWRVRDTLAPKRQHQLASISMGAITIWLAGTAGAAVLLQWGLYRWSASQSIIQTEIEKVVEYQSVVVTNRNSTYKYLERIKGLYFPLNTTDMTAPKLRRLARRYDGVVLVLLDRSDSVFWREEARDNASLVVSLGTSALLQVDRQITTTDRLRIWRLPKGEP